TRRASNVLEPRDDFGHLALGSCVSSREHTKAWESESATSVAERWACRHRQRAAGHGGGRGLRYLALRRLAPEEVRRRDLHPLPGDDRRGPPDAVIVATPTSTHFACAQYALGRDVHLF